MAECKCLKILKLVILFDMFLSRSFKMTTRFPNIAGTTASAIEFIYYERFQIIKNWVFI